MTSAEQSPLSEISVYPNPFSSKLLIELETSSSVELMDSEGTILKTMFIQSGEIDVEGLPAGTYFINIIGIKGKRTAKVIQYEK